MNDLASLILTITQDQAQTLIIATVFGGFAWMMLRRARTRKGPGGVDARAGQQASQHRDRVTAQARDDISELMVRLDELSREICGQIDTRFAKLEHTIREADIKLAALKKASREIAETQPAAPGDPKHADVYQRWQDGQTTLEIARQMDMPVGEVELILSLERNRRGDDGARAAKGQTVAEVEGPAPTNPPPARGAEKEPSRLDERA